MLEIALTYAAYGWKIFPCTPNAKHPIMDKGYLTATTDEATIRAWWSIWPDANPALALAPSGLVAIDADTYKPDCEWPGYTAETYQQVTGRGGLHMVFTTPPATYPGKLCQGVDIKHNGYILLAGSTVDGNLYTVSNNVAPAPVPEWVPTREVGQSNPDQAAASVDDIISALAVIPNDTPDWEWWSRIAGAVFNAGGTFEQFDAWSRQCSSYDARETQAKWTQVQRSPYRDVGMGTLFYEATKANPAWQRPSRIGTAFTTAVTVPGERTGPQFLDVASQAEWFKGCCYVIAAHRVLMPNGALLKPEQFRAAMGGYEFVIDPSGGRPTKNAFEAFTESRITRWPRADAMCFRPEVAPGAIINENGLSLVNTYVPAHVVLGTGDVTPFIELIQKLLPDPNDQAILLAYLAALRQYPGVKFRWCPLIQGVQGNSKGVIMACAEYAVGERYTHKPNAKELGDSGAKFTGWLDRKLLILIEEIYVSDRREVLDALKPLITDDRVEIQHKGSDQITGENRANFILTSNHKDAVLKTTDDRRYAVFYTAQQSYQDLERDGMTGNYMPRMWQWLRQGGFADVAGYLQRYEIPDALNPATDCHRAPDTSSTADAIRESRGLIEQEILAACEEGRPGFSGGWISSVALTRLLRDMRRTLAPRKRGALLASIGYVPHPALPNGQCNQAIMQEEQKRPYLYVLKDSIAHLNVTDGGDAMRAYMRAQGYADAGRLAG